MNANTPSSAYQHQTASPVSVSQLKHLPAFAAWLLQNSLLPFTEEQIRLSRSVNLPLMQAFSHLPEEQLVAISLESTKELLTYLAENRAEQQIEQAHNQWIRNQLPNIDRNVILAEDITLISFIRKQAFLHFIPQYTANLEEALQLVSELDRFLTRSETESTNTYINLLRDRINEQAYLTEKITNTSPGIIYLLQIGTRSVIFANETAARFTGISEKELMASKGRVLELLIHPEDQQATYTLLKEISESRDKELWNQEFRVRNKQGEYVWMRNYISVFRRNAEGYPLEIIGNILDIQKEVETSGQLKQREYQLLEAQQIARIGSFTWYFDGRPADSTPELYHILNLSQDDPDGFRRRVHPADLPKVDAAIREALETGDFECEFRYEGMEEIMIWSRGRVSYENGNPIFMRGTIMDITERSVILERLRNSEKMYQQAEELANIGNWTWDIRTNKLKWTDQLYRIYGLEPQSEEITIERFLSFIHPDDRPAIEISIRQIELEDSIDFTFRIVAANGTEKIIRSRAQVEAGEDGSVLGMIGTEQDITGQQKLLQQLQESDELFRQAQSLAHVGNWSWDIPENKVYWSDELYRIFGLEPQSIDIDFDQYTRLLHPEDREQVIATIRQALQSHQPYKMRHRLQLEDGSIRTIQAFGEVIANREKEPVRLLGTAQDVTDYYELIGRLEKSEALYKQAQSIAHIGNWSFDVQTRVTTWSDELCRIYELPQCPTITFEQYLSFVHPEDLESAMAYLEKCLEEKTSYELKHRIITGSGRVKMLHRRGQMRLNAAGEPVEILGTTQDITEQYAYETEIRDKQNFIQKIANATPSIIASYNVHTGTYSFVSEGLQKILGYDPQEPLARGISFFIGLVHPDDLKSLTDKNNLALAEANQPGNKDKDAILEFTYRMQHRNGHYRWFHTYGTIFDRNAAGHVEHVLNISLDVTEQVEATRKIKEQEHFIQQIADASPTILYLYDVESAGFVYLNREIFFVLGYTPEEIIDLGKEATERLYHADDVHLLPERPGSGKTFQQADSMIQYECRMRSREGDWRWFLVREIVFTSGETGIRQILGAALDIDRRKEMEKKLLQNSFQLEQSNASLEEFAYVASHDLKEPLRKISTFGDRLSATQAEVLSPDGKIYLKKIVDASQRMQVMINDLLSISMISGNRSYEPYSLQLILEETLQTLEFKLEQKNAVVESDPLPEASIVPSQFRQLFQNILSNSLKFVKEDVQPLIRITHRFLEPDALGTFNLAKAKVYHQLQFTDNGIGFENEFAGKIFAIFQRLHGRSEYEGTGIGLAICKKIVEHHGGIIYASGLPGEGATFTIILPV